MAELKTKETFASVNTYLNAIEDPDRRTDCEAIAALMQRITKAEPRMWGSSIVGFAVTITNTRVAMKVTHASWGFHPGKPK